LVVAGVLFACVLLLRRFKWPFESEQVLAAFLSVIVGEWAVFTAPWYATWSPGVAFVIVLICAAWAYQAEKNARRSPRSPRLDGHIYNDRIIGNYSSNPGGGWYTRALLFVYVSNRGRPSVASEFQVSAKSKDGKPISVRLAAEQPEPDSTDKNVAFSSMAQVAHFAISPEKAADMYLWIELPTVAPTDVDRAAWLVEFQDDTKKRYRAKPTSGLLGSIGIDDPVS
jgi:hypothetical protein